LPYPLALVSCTLKIGRPKFFVMKKYFQLAVVISYCFALFGCQKEMVAEKNEDAQLLSRAGSGCKLVKFDNYKTMDDVLLSDQMYYRNGLLEEWTVYYGTRYKLIYSRKGVLETAYGYNGFDHIYTITFEYTGGRVSKENWYEGGTSNLLDEVSYNYNGHGQIIRVESSNLGYVTENTFTNGSLTRWIVSFNGAPAMMGEYTYNNSMKNPFTTLAGLPHAFPYINPAYGKLIGGNWYSSEKITTYVNSNPVVMNNPDPGLTAWGIGASSFPVTAVYSNSNNVNSNWTNFYYDDCKTGKTSPSEFPVDPSAIFSTPNIFVKGFGGSGAGDLLLLK
jgi:hypothetical protein